MVSLIHICMQVRSHQSCQRAVVMFQLAVSIPWRLIRDMELWRVQSWLCGACVVVIPLVLTINFVYVLCFTYGHSFKLWATITLQPQYCGFGGLCNRNCGCISRIFPQFIATQLQLCLQPEFRTMLVLLVVDLSYIVLMLQFIFLVQGGYGYDPPRWFDEIGPREEVDDWLISGCWFKGDYCFLLVISSTWLLLLTKHFEVFWCADVCL